MPCSKSSRIPPRPPPSPFESRPFPPQCPLVAVSSPSPHLLPSPNLSPFRRARSSISIPNSESLSVPNNSHSVREQTCIPAVESSALHQPSRSRSPAPLPPALQHRAHTHTPAQIALLARRGTTPSQCRCRAVCRRPSESPPAPSPPQQFPAAPAASAERSPVVAHHDSKPQSPKRLHPLRAARHLRYARPSPQSARPTARESISNPPRSPPISKAPLQCPPWTLVLSPAQRRFPNSAHHHPSRTRQAIADASKCSADKAAFQKTSHPAALSFRYEDRARAC